MPQLKQGLLIAIEGIDGSGKSTLAKNISALFDKQGYDVVLTKEPGGSALGQKIRAIVQQKAEPRCPKAEFLLFAADRAQHFDEIVIPALTENKLIFSDRLIDSSFAYQGYGNNLDLESIKMISHWAMNNVMPHLTIFVQIPVKIALERVSQRNNALSPFEKETFLDNVAYGFEELYKKRTNVIVVDGTQTIETITQKTYSALEQWIYKNNYIL